MADRQLEFFVYDHDERSFDYFEGDRTKLEDIMSAENPEAISTELDEENIDGLLVLDEDGGRWFLAFSESLGIVGQRTGRRQADSIVRSGYQLPDGYWLKGDYPLEELSDPNIGDLWQSVQQKYVKSTLGGMDLDEETGIPAQLAERAKDMEASGVSDDLTEAKFEKEEAEARKKAEEKSAKKTSKSKKTPSKKSTKDKSKSSTKKSTKPKESKKKSSTASSPKKTSATKSTSKKKSTTSEDNTLVFVEIEKVRNYVTQGNSKIVLKGNLSEGTDKPEEAVVILDQDKLDSKEWNEIAVFLDKGDVVQISTEKTSDGLFATSIKI